MDLLVLADSDGVVDMTLEAISRRTNVPIEEVRKYIQELSQPDPLSRSKDQEGKRLVPIDSSRDWGWQIVNYRLYRKLRDEEARRTYFRDIKRQQRKRQKANVQDKLVDTGGRCQIVPSASASSSAYKKEKKSTVRTSLNGLIDSEWIASLKADPTYRGIDVDRELGRMTNWCKIRGLTSTRRRFVNWLNRTDKPLTGAGSYPKGWSQKQIAEYEEAQKKYG